MTAANIDACWFAVWTKPKCEALAAEHLGRQAFPVFAPRVRCLKRSPQGMKQIIEPLFPRYLFIRAQADGWTLGPVRSTRGVSALVRFGQRAAPVPERVIASIEKRIDPDGFVSLDAPACEVGAEVRVTQGPLSGLQGIFQAEAGHERVRLLMNVLGEEISVNVPRAHLVYGFNQAWA